MRSPRVLMPGTTRSNTTGAEMGWLKGLWSRAGGGRSDRNRRGPDFSAEPRSIGSDLGWDLHSHIVPGVDDGAADLVASLAMLNGLRDLGYRGAILTPHVYADLYPNTPASLAAPFAALQAATTAWDPSFRLHLAAEYLLDEHFARLLAAGDALTFPATSTQGEPLRCVLVEFGFVEAPIQAREVFFEAQMQGLTPVLAHVERYPYYYRDLAAIEALADRGVVLTVNVASLAGAYGPEAYRVAAHLLDRGLCGTICSDAHAMRHIESLAAIQRSPVVHRALDRGTALRFA